MSNCRQSLLHLRIALRSEALRQTVVIKHSREWVNAESAIDLQKASVLGCLLEDALVQPQYSALPISRFNRFITQEAF